jgi:predicted Zn-dependent protease
MNSKNSYLRSPVFWIFLLAAGLFALPAKSQDSNAYFIANQMLQSQQYERAYEMFYQLHTQNPENYLFLEKATESLINLKRYETAIEITSRARNQSYFPAQAGIRLGEIYHISGDTLRAFSIWDKVKEQNPRNLEIYLSMARAMSDRRAFEPAIETYKAAAKLFSDTTVLSSELANTYMKAGRYEESIREYLDLIKQNPDRINYVQSTLLRFNDDYLYDIAILEIGDFLEELPATHPSYRDLHQLELWLLLERELYERALATAREFEESQSYTSYSLYGLGAKLLSDRQFELAEQAYRYYVENNIEVAKYQSMEEIATIYIEWADYLSDFNLSSGQRRDSLYRKAFETLSTLEKEAPGYRNMDRVYITQAELALEHLHQPRHATDYLAKLQQRADSSNLAQRSYIEGRIYLYENNYSRARIAFTKSNKDVRLGELAEKARYYLALTDFYAGDYEFAKIQLNALERQTTSYFANDAVQLRVWIQDGLQADSTGALLDPFAKAVEYFAQGLRDSALITLDPLITENSYNPLSDEALLELSSHVTTDILALTYARLTRYLNTAGRVSPLRERLMWEKARIGDRYFSQNETHSQAVSTASGDSEISMPENRGQIITLYEEIILEYPQGFYASFARSRIEELQNIET